MLTLRKMYGHLHRVNATKLYAGFQHPLQFYNESGGDICIHEFPKIVAVTSFLLRSKCSHAGTGHNVTAMGRPERL